MKGTDLLLILVFVTNWGFSQKKAMTFLPILFDTVKVDIKDKRKRLEIKDTLFSDTVRIGFKVTLEFKYPLNDTTKAINIKSLKLISLDVKSLTTEKQYRIDLLRKNKWFKCKRDIWNRYSEIFNYWYWNQPYEKMIDRQAYGNKVYLGGVLYAIP
jgi:hypothetical protein